MSPIEPTSGVELTLPGVGGTAATRKTIGRVAGLVIAISGVVAVIALAFSGRHLTLAFYGVIALSLAAGVGCILLPWDQLSERWLHLIPILATGAIALGIRFAGVYGDIAASYYVFVGLFAAWAFSSRRAVVGHVTLAAIAATLPLLYRTAEVSHPGARTGVVVMMLVVVAAVVTMLREGLQRRQRELEDLTRRDPLTGVGNYRHLAGLLSHEVARHVRSGESLTVLVIDLDGFKAINDSVGHLVGDKVLIEVARALSSVVRAQDAVARQGGDEFSILAPQTDSEQAAVLARRAAEAIRAATDGFISASIGWATFPADTADPSALLALADADLRRAKQHRGGPGRASGSGPLHLVTDESG